jgi:hypothetical protein
MPDLDDLIANLTEARDAGGVLVAYELTPKTALVGRLAGTYEVDFRAQVVMPEGWKPRL